MDDCVVEGDGVVDCWVVVVGSVVEACVVEGSGVVGNSVVVVVCPCPPWLCVVWFTDTVRISTKYVKIGSECQ